MQRFPNISPKLTPVLLALLVKQGGRHISTSQLEVHAHADP